MPWAKILPISRWRHRCYRLELSAYLDHRLDRQRQGALETHLASCDACQRALASLRQTVALLRALPFPPLPRSFAIHQALPAAQPSWVPLLRLATATATAAFLVFFALDLYRESSIGYDLAAREAPKAMPAVAGEERALRELPPQAPAPPAVPAPQPRALAPAPPEATPGLARDLAREEERKEAEPPPAPKPPAIPAAPQAPPTAPLMLAPWTLRLLAGLFFVTSAVLGGLTLRLARRERARGQRRPPL